MCAVNILRKKRRSRAAHSTTYLLMAITYMLGRTTSSMSINRTWCLLRIRVVSTLLIERLSRRSMPSCQKSDFLRFSPTLTLLKRRKNAKFYRLSGCLSTFTTPMHRLWPSTMKKFIDFQVSAHTRERKRAKKPRVQAARGFFFVVDECPMSFLAISLLFSRPCAVYTVKCDP